MESITKQTLAWTMLLMLAVTLTGCGGGGGSSDDSSDDGTTDDTPVPGTFLGTPVSIEGNAGDAVSPQIAVDADGNAMLVWQQYNDAGSLTTIWANRYSVGSGWGSPQKISSNTDGSALYPNIAMSANGDAIAIWPEMSADGTIVNLMSCHYTASGGWGTPELAENDDTNSVAMVFILTPQVAMDTAGNAIAVWGHEGSGARDIMANYYSAGSGWNGESVIDSHDNGDAYGASIAMNDNGDAMVVWFQEDGDINRVWARGYTSGWGTATTIDDDATDSSGYPQVGIDAAGNATAVWTNLNEAALSLNIGTSYYQPATGWAAESQMDQGYSSAAYYLIAKPQVIMDDAGDAYAAWTDTGYGVMANRYSVADNAWAASTSIETQYHESTEPRLAVDNNGNAIAVWAGDGLRASRYVAGTGWQGQSSRITDVETAYDQQVVMDADGNTIVVWVQDDGGTQNIWANRF